MAMNKNKSADGRVNAENISGAKVPRRAGLVNETQGKSAGTRDTRKVGGQSFNFVNKQGR
jgi:hypothetical protein